MFKFKLQKALDIKIQEEDLKRKELTDKQQLLENEKEKLNQINNKIIEMIHSYSKNKTGSLNIALMNSYENFIRKLKLEKEDQIDIVDLVEKKVEEAKNMFLEVRKERKIFEKLKEKRYENFMKEELKKEQNFIDELSTSIFNRRR